MVASSIVSESSPLRLLEIDAADLARYPDALSDIFTERATGAVIRGVFPADALAAVVARLEAGDFGLESQPSTAFVGQTYGRVLIVGDRDLDEYFREAARFRAACDELFGRPLGFQARVEAVLAAIAGGRSVQVPAGPAGEPYAPATIRGLHAGGEIDLHCENETVEFPAMWHLSQVVRADNQLSFYVMLAIPEAGGELVIHNARFADGAAGGRLASMERNEQATLDMLAPYGQIVPRTAVGDMIVFDAGRHFHRVTAVIGPRHRWTMGGFLARSRDDRIVHYWS